MADIITVILDLVFIAFGVFGIYVFWVWHKIGKRMDAILSEMEEKYENHQTQR